MFTDMPLSVFTGNTHPDLAHAVCDYLKIPLASAEVFQFSNENIFVRINETVRELLAFSRPQDPVLRDEDVHVILDEILAMLSNHFISFNIQLLRSFEALPPLVRADRNQLKQVFLNLFLNAIDAMPAGGVLTVGTRSLDNGRIRVNVEDTGTGVEEKNLSKLFEPFYTNKDTGTGLGLSIAFRIIEKHGGRIFAQNRTDRKGLAISVEV